MEKKFLAKLLAVSMAVTAVPVLPGIEAGADAKELGITSQRIESGYSDSVNNNRKAGADAPGTNFSNVATQPAISYTFDSTEGLELAGGANVTDGVLNLAKGETVNQTYAKIADLSEIDFGNGITLTADIKVTGWISDWTPIFMLGDSTVGGGAEGCALAYHFTQGFSSREDINNLGYFGNLVAAPYKWNWYCRPSRQNRWDTITVTIDANTMSTYIDGVLVQSAAADYTALINALKSAKNNYLGGSYFADADFQGSMDNVGIYNTALAAEDVAKLTSTVPAEAKQPLVLDCELYRTAFSNGYEITEEGAAVTFDSETYSNALSSWYCPALTVYEAKSPAAHHINYVDLTKIEGYSGLLYARADNWGYACGIDPNDEDADGNKDSRYVKDNEKWNELGYNWVTRGIPDWNLFLESNKAGVKGEASAVYKDGKILVKLSLNGVVNLISFPYEKKDGTNIYFSLTGEMCELSNIAESTFTGITIPSGIATYPVNMPTPTPAPTLPPAGEDNGEGLELDCEGWWTAHTSGIEVTDNGVALTFKNNTYSAAANQWEVPVVVAYAGDEAKVNGAGYDEYAVIRGDAYAWTTKAADANTGAGLAAWNNLGYTFQSNASTFDTWLADNKAGTDCKIQAIKKDGKVIIETTVGSVTSYTTFPVDAGKKVYISLSGEKCKLTNIKTAQYTAINLPGEVPSATATPAPSADPAATPEPGTTPAPGATATPGTTPAPGTTVDPGTQTPGTTDTPEEPSEEDNKKKTMKVSGITAKTGKKKVTGNLSVKGTKVQVKVGNKKYKNAKVNGKKFTFTVSSKLKKGTKITIKVTKSGYKTVTKTVKVK